MRLPALEHSFGSRLSRDLTIAEADPTFALTPLSGPEQATLKAFSQEQRRRDWLRGRNALKQVLEALGRDTDTSCIEFPHRQLSLTHAGDSAYSIADISRSVGTGIDYEPFRAVSPGVSRFFLNESEAAWLDTCDASDAEKEVIRLWTVKEAAFKSHPSNSGLVLADFSITEPGSAITSVTTQSGGYDIRVVSKLHDDGYLSVAVCEEQIR